MLEQDYIMRLIKEMVRAVLKLLFNIDTEAPAAELLEDREEKARLDSLLAMIDNGSIDMAEDIVFEMADAGEQKDLKSILLFYSYLNDKSDDFLKEHNFNREELRDDLKYILGRYGLDSVSEIFL